MIITNITIDPTIDASLIVSCSYLFNSIPGHVNVLTLCSGKYKGCSVEGKTHIKIPLKTLKQQGLLSFPSRGECSVMICSWGWKAQAEWQFESKQHRMILLVSSSLQAWRVVLLKISTDITEGSNRSIITLHYLRYRIIMKIIHH